MTMRNSRIIIKTFALLALVAAVSGCVNMPPPGESYYNKGVDLYDEEKFAEAIEQYKLELRQNPDNQFARYNLAVTHHDLGHDDEAEKLYREILKTTEDTSSRINLSTIYFSRGQEEAAYNELKIASQNNPDSAKPLSVLGEFQERKGMLDEARLSYLAALRIDDQHAFTHYRLGRLDLGQGKIEPAIASINTAIGLDPEVAMFYETQSQAYIKNGSDSQAISMLEQASTLKPDNVQLYVQLGDLYNGVTDYENSARNYQEAISVCKSLNDCEEDPAVHRKLETVYVILAGQAKEKQESLNQGRAVAKSSGQP